jgi:hypothetical protein
MGMGLARWAKWTVPPAFQGAVVVVVTEVV